MPHSEIPLQASEPAINPALEHFIRRACERGWVDLGEILDFAADMRSVFAEDAANAIEGAQPPAPALAPLHHSDLAFRSRVADLLHLLPMTLTFMPGDRATGEKTLADIRAKLAAPLATTPAPIGYVQQDVLLGLRNGVSVASTMTTFPTVLNTAPIFDGPPTAYRLSAEAAEEVQDKQRRIIEAQADQITALKIDLLYAQRPPADHAEVMTAARNLIKGKGRYHTEQNYKALADALAQHDIAAAGSGEAQEGGK